MEPNDQRSSHTELLDPQNLADRKTRNEVAFRLADLARQFVAFEAAAFYAKASGGPKPNRLIPKGF
jgi:hypothetical protein